MRKIYIRPVLAMLILALVAFQPAEAQKKSKKKKGEPVAAPKPKKKDPFKSIEEVTKGSKLTEGLFDIYQDTVSGKIRMKVTEDQLGKEFIYVALVRNGVLDARYFTGLYRSNRIFSINRYFDKIEIQIENTRYHFDEDKPISRAKDANINTPVVFSGKIEAANKEMTEFLIDANSLFLTESFTQIKPSPRPGQNPNQFSLGNLSKSKSKVLDVKNYPENTDVITDLVYDSRYPRNGGSSAVTDGRSVSIQVQHSLIEVPENDYEARADDPRVGYFTQYVDDQTAYDVLNYKDVINRWHLVKKDPSAELSEPVEPITWWVENTTPMEVRQYVIDGALAWNKAFESAGFKNAIAVKVQPDDADWDAGDLRYNVLRWTSSPNPPFGGYGPSFVNPRTGQILGADIMLEQIVITYRYLQQDLFDLAGLPMEQDDLLTEDGHMLCSHSNFKHQDMLFGKMAMESMDFSVTDQEKYLKQYIYDLVLHEVGHTLGLYHNMRGSQLHTPDKVNDAELTSTVGLTGSVMDYSPANISRDKEAQGDFFHVVPGPYDHWVIRYGYSQTDAAGLKAILDESTNPDHAFGNDADDMRSAGIHIDPRVMIGDFTKDPVKHSIDRVEIVNSIYPKLIEKYSDDNDSYNDLLVGYLVLSGNYATSVRVMTRQIGGVHIDRSYAGQEGAAKPYEPVAYKTQKDAMKALEKYAFAPDAIKVPSEVYNYLQLQRRGFTMYGRNEDPHIHDRYLNIHKDVLNHLTHPNVWKRITDTQLYGNEYDLTEMVTDLTNAIFTADLNKNVNTFRQNLQQEYVDRLISVLDKKSRYDNISKNMAFYELKRINRMMKNSGSPNTSTRAHRQYISYKIDQAMDN